MGAELRQHFGPDIAGVLGGAITVEDGALVFTGLVQLAGDSTVTAADVMSMLRLLSLTRALTDGQSTLDLNTVTAAGECRLWVTPERRSWGRAGASGKERRLAATRPQDESQHPMNLEITTQEN